MLSTVKDMKPFLLPTTILTAVLAFSILPAGAALAMNPDEEPTSPGFYDPKLYDADMDCLKPGGIKITPEGIEPLPPQTGGDIDEEIVDEGPDWGDMPLFPPGDDDEPFYQGPGFTIDKDGKVTITEVPTTTESPKPSPLTVPTPTATPTPMSTPPDWEYDDWPDSDEGDGDEAIKPLCGVPCDGFDFCEPVSDGSLTIAAGDPVAASEEAAKLVRDAGGQVTARTAYAPDDRGWDSSDRGSASLTLRIPSAKLSQTLDRLEALGRLQSLQISYPEEGASKNAMSTISFTIDSDRNAPFTVPGFFWGGLLAALAGLILCIVLVTVTVLLIVRGQRRKNAPTVPSHAAAPASAPQAEVPIPVQPQVAATPKVASKPKSKVEPKDQ